MRFPALFGLCLVALFLAPPCETAAQPAANAEDQAARYRALLAQGRKLLAARKPARAVVKLAEAVALQPDSVDALVELGWAAFLAGDIVQALEASQRAAELDTPPRLGAALAYNLGRIHEHRGLRSVAMDYYQESVQARPSQQVSARLASLRDPLHLLPMRGPYRSREKLCQALDAESAAITDRDEARRRCDHMLKGKRDRVASPPAPYRTIALHHLTALDEYHAVVLRTEAGWYIDGGGIDAGSERARASITTETLALETRDVQPGGAPEVLWKFRITVEDDGSGREDATGNEPREVHEFDELVVCGLAPSGVPACSGSIPVAVRHYTIPRGKRQPTRDERVDYGTRFLPDGRIELAADPARGAALDYRRDQAAITAVLGSHPLTWP